MNHTQLKAIDDDTLGFAMRIRRNIAERGLAFIKDSLSTESIQCCVSELFDCTGVSMTDAQMQLFIDLHPTLRADIFCNAIGDTDTRDNFMRVLTQYLCGFDYFESRRLHTLMQAQVDAINWSFLG